MTSFLETIEKLSAQLLPYIIMGNILPIYMIPLIMCCPIVIKYFYDVIEKWWNKNKCTICIMDHTPSSWNTFYEVVSYILEKHNLIDTAKQQTSYRTFRSNNDVYTNWSPSQGKLKFVHKNFSVEIETQSLVENKLLRKCFYVYGNDANDIKLFKKYLTKMTMKYDLRDTRKYKLMQCDSTKYEWDSVDINVIKTFDNIFLANDNKSLIQLSIDKFFNGKEMYNRFGIPRKLGLLFYGIPGTGKSSTAYAIAKTHDMNIYVLHLKCSKSNLLKQVGLIKKNSIILFEDIDTIPIAQERTHDIVQEPNDKDKTDKVIDMVNLGDILELLDGYCYFNECIIIMTTNHIEKLDEALIRPGRIDHKIKYDFLTKQIVFDIIKYFYNIELETNVLDKINYSGITSAKLINTIILPNIDNYDYVLNYLLENNDD